MLKQIKFNNGTEEKILTVQSIFAYTYNAIKTVLKITLSEKDCSFSDIETLKQNTGDITYVEDDDVKSVYSGYEYAEKGFICNYNEGIFDVEIAQSSEIEARVGACEEAIESIMLMLADE